MKAKKVWIAGLEEFPEMCEVSFQNREGEYTHVCPSYDREEYLPYREYILIEVEE